MVKNLRIKHIQGTVGTTKTEVATRISFQSILIDNTDVANTLYVSFDDGTTFKTIPASASISVDAPQNYTAIWVNHLYLKASAANTSFEILLVEDLLEMPPAVVQSQSTKPVVTTPPPVVQPPPVTPTQPITQPTQPTQQATTPEIPWGAIVLGAAGAAALYAASKDKDKDKKKE